MITKTTKTTIFSVVAIAAILGFGITSFATAEISNNDIPEPVDVELKNYELVENFQEFSDAKINQYRLQIESNTEMKSLMKDSDFEYNGISYILGPTTIADITYKSEDGTKILVTFDNDKIVDYKKYESKGKWGWANGYVNKYYDSSTYAAKGIGHKFDLPSSFSSTDTNDWTSLLTNAVKNGSDLVNDDLCVAANAPDSYWAQAGVQFDDNGMRAGWADTEEGCDPTFFSLTINDGDTIEARVYLDTTVANKWWMSVDNMDDMLGPALKSKTITGSTSVIKNEPATGVWFESTYTPTETWAGDFGSDITSDWASYKYTSNNSWYLWGVEAQDTSICKPTANPTTVISGAFDSGNRDVTWDISDIEDDCGGGVY